ncbi:uncharacterized protein LOC118231967 isoform X1 [Anguilla anguilla]|uniref:uncharacterized protein LOC118220233 isoform X1 n=1 Tax=Anguilla anguilla TaxID=7936 RepID=UPI0015A90A1D|nr:uncharacterized protein LOC118220233 isoform X1 [Anguilla anguilla]XP_035282310.1 uncharacterized protein LOC118231967 isoform X1 [Anguilla anguilla]
MAYCCVPRCTSYQRRECDQGLSFHRFPSNPDTRRQWIAKIRRDVGPYFQITDNTKVCSKHFPKDCILRSLTGLNKLKNGSVPSLFTWCQPKTRRTIQRFQSATGDFGEEEEEVDISNLHEEEKSLPVLGALCDHDYEEETLSVEEQLDAAQREIARLQEENETLRSEQFHLQRFQCEPKLIMFYTGFKDYDTLKAVFLALKPTSESMVRWSQMQRLNHTEEHIVKAGFHAQHLCLFDQFFLFLCRVRQGFFTMDLSVRFKVSQATVSRTCITWGNYLFFMLGTLPVWPSREAIDELMPPLFKNTFPKARVVLDCTEIHIQTASSKVLNTVTYSHYKGTTTLKSLIGITPSGSICLVSNLYTGSISDKEITKESGILSLLQPGDEVIADKGFLIRDLLTDINVKLVIPTFLGPSGQFSKAEITHTQEIARLRIHVERAIRRIKEYHIFDSVIPLSLCGSVNQLWTVCALLTNFQGPLF